MGRESLQEISYVFRGGNTYWWGYYLNETLGRLHDSPQYLYRAVAILYIMSDEIVESPVCPLCERADRKELEEAIISGNLTKTAVANSVGMSVEEVYEHMKTHLTPGKINRHSRQIEAGLDDKYNKYDILFNNLVDLNSLFGTMVQQAVANPDSVQITRLTKLASEIRQSISDLARLRGEMASETQITIIQYNQLKNVVMSNLCPECRRKVVESLESEEFKKKIQDMVRL